jgi:plastocyanin
MKKILVVLAILFIGILLAGCTSQPAKPVATPVPTAVPTTVVVTVPPTPVPTKEIIVVVVNKTANVTATPTANVTAVPTYTITFNPNRLIASPGLNANVKVGTKVIWANMDTIYPHGLTATDTTNDGFWLNNLNAPSIPYGKTVEVTFTKAGAYEYDTLFQPATSGTIYVTA